MRFFNSLLVGFFFMATLILASSCTQEPMSEQEIEVVMRTIGHEVLKAHDDTTSRVLPVTSKGVTYVIQFDTQFVFQAAKLATAVDKVVRDYNFASAYLVEMQHCVTEKTIHSYQVNTRVNTSMIPCGVRAQPKACYNLLFTSIDRSQLAEVFSLIKNSSISAKVIWSMVVFLALGLLYFVYQKRTVQKINPNIISIGSYQFDPQKVLLSKADLNVTLTSTEADLLTLLYGSVNTTISREEILHQVWGNNGDYMGRTLDVFISKLRKKFIGDPNIKIANIRGVGYRLEVYAK